MIYIMDDQIYNFCEKNKLEQQELVGILNNCLNHIAKHMLYEIKDEKKNVSTQTDVEHVNFSTMNKNQLQNECKIRGIQKVSHMNKSQLIEKLKSV